MEAHYTLTVDELLEARNLHGKHLLRLPFRVAVTALLVFILILGVFSISQRGASVPSVLMIVLPVYFIFFRRYDQKWAARRAFQQRPHKGSAVDWVFTDEILTITSSSGEMGQMPWSSFSKAVISKKGLLLYPIPQIFYWLPSHAFDSEAGFVDFVALVRTKVPKVYEA